MEFSSFVDFLSINMKFYTYLDFSQSKVFE